MSFFLHQVSGLQLQPNLPWSDPHKVLATPSKYHEPSELFFFFFSFFPPDIDHIVLV